MRCVTRVMAPACFGATSSFTKTIAVLRKQQTRLFYFFFTYWSKIYAHAHALYYVLYYPSVDANGVRRFFGSLSWFKLRNEFIFHRKQTL